MTDEAATVPEAEFPLEELAQRYERELGQLYGRAVRAEQLVAAERQARTALYQDLLRLGRRLAELEAEAGASNSVESANLE